MRHTIRQLSLGQNFMDAKEMETALCLAYSQLSLITFLQFSISLDPYIF
jgi:hypothetical protein